VPTRTCGLQVQSVSWIQRIYQRATAAYVTLFDDRTVEQKIAEETAMAGVALVMLVHGGSTDAAYSKEKEKIWKPPPSLNTLCMALCSGPGHGNSVSEAISAGYGDAKDSSSAQ
jgi:hypothetical protein